jgi:two-component system chemotaxis response regulator CheB
MDHIVVIGASQGAIAALRGLISELKKPFPAPILVVVHIGDSQSILPTLLQDMDSVTASFAVSGEPLTEGHVHVAPPGRHMLVRDGILELSRGPRENWARPAIDPLFRSAALAYGPDAIGIVLSGRLNDGTAGLYEIKRQGGIAIVQTPAEAEAPDMPQSALENVPVDYSLPAAGIGRLLTRLVHEPPQERSRSRGLRTMELEHKIIEPGAQTCPECGGAMREERKGGLTSFRCHIGHVMTAEILAATQVEMLERDMSTVLRTLNERAGLCRSLAAKHHAAGNEAAAATWTRAADEAARRETAFQELVRLPWHHPESEEEPVPGESAA